MNKQTIVSLIIGLVIGSFVTYGIVLGATNSEPGGHNLGMADMNASLQGKTGDAFDKEFIIQMIEHHEGAIDMAEAAKQNAGHKEIKDLAEDIITAQTNEIDMMKQWQKEWGY